MDAQAHVNHALYLDYLQEARVDFLLSSPDPLPAMLGSGVLVVGHQVEYVAPVAYAGQSVDVDLWVDRVGGSRFVIGYEVFDSGRLAARARTAVAPYDLAGDALRRLTAEERTGLLAWLAPAEPLRVIERPRWLTGGHVFCLRVRWSDLDSYGHVNNVKYADFYQEARVTFTRDAIVWRPDGEWVVARQDIDYRKPIDFRSEPYEVHTLISHIGNRSFVVAAEIRDQRAGGFVHSASRTVVVSRNPLTDEQRATLSTVGLGS